MNKKIIQKEIIKIRTSLTKDYTVLKDERVKVNLNNEFLEWENNIGKKIKTNNPFIETKIN